MAQQNLDATTHGDVRTKANANFTELYAHAANTANPHTVTKAQVGLGNVDNTSDTNKPVSSAQQAAIDAAVIGLLDFKGNLDCSTNPNYPVGLIGDAYSVTVAGKIGGASGVVVEVADMIVCKLDNAGGTHASVGTSWFVIEHNVTGALVAANNLSDLNNAATALINLGGQAALVSGTNIKTINGTALPGSGDFVVGTGYHADVESFRDRVIGAGATIDTQTMNALDRFVTTGLSEGWYIKCLEIYPFVSSTLAGSLQKLKYTAQSALTNVSSLFTSANYSQASGFGTSAIIAGAQLTTGFIPSAQGVTNSNAFLFAANTGIVPILDSGGVVGDIGSNAGEGDWYYRHDVPTIGVGKLAEMNTFYQEHRVMGASLFAGGSRGFLDGVQFVNGSAGAGAWTGAVTMFRSTRFGSTYGQVGKLGCVVIGGSSALTSAEGAGLARAIRRLQEDVGRALYKPQTATIVGDSISTFYSAPDESYAVLALKRKGHYTQNMAVPSTGVSAALFPFTNLSTEIANYVAEKPNIITIMYGTNDLLSSVSAATYETGMQTLIAGLVAAKKKVVVCSIPYHTVQSEASVRAFVAKSALVARNNNCIHVDMDRAIRDKTTPGSFMGDTTHPNAAGHRLMAERLFAALDGIVVRELSLDFGSILAQTTADLTVAMLNVDVGQRVTVVPPVALNAGLVVNAFVSAADTVTVRITNVTSGAIDPAAGFYGLFVGAYI